MIFDIRECCSCSYKANFFSQSSYKMYLLIRTIVKQFNQLWLIYQYPEGGYPVQEGQSLNPNYILIRADVVMQKIQGK